MKPWRSSLKALNVILYMKRLKTDCDLSSNCFCGFFWLRCAASKKFIVFVLYLKLGREFIVVHEDLDLETRKGFLVIG